jgi:hypothetical protein
MSGTIAAVPDRHLAGLRDVIRISTEVPAQLCLATAFTELALAM